MRSATPLTAGRRPPHLLPVLLKGDPAGRAVAAPHVPPPAGVSELRSAIPGQVPEIDLDLLATLRGIAVDPDLPGDDRWDELVAFHEREAAWLAGDGPIDDPAQLRAIRLHSAVLSIETPLAQRTQSSGSGGKR